MSTKYLKRFFKPRSIAVFGASEKAESMGGIVIQNLIDSNFPGTLMAVNPEGYDAVYGVSCYRGITELPEMPDLAIICAPPEAVADIVRKLGANLVKAALILTGGLSLAGSRSAEALAEEVKEAARPYGIRIMGPDCMGMLVPGSNMNASYSHINITKGKVAYIGQSGLLGTAMIDWAAGQGIGFSHFLTLGEGGDVDLPSVIDYVAQDPYTHSILLQIDHVTGSSRNFISALRAASRNKLVLVLKSDDVTVAKPAPAPGIPDENTVYNAALRRAGVVRVTTSDELFHALETLSRMKPLRGERIALLCNGSGPNALATDRLIRQGGQLAPLSEATVEALREIMPNSNWNGLNPVDLNADATPERFAQAAAILIKDKAVDAVLSIHAPTRLAPSVETADALVAVARKSPRNFLTCWMGRATAIDARNHCNNANIATFITPEEAVDAFLHMVDYRKNQEVMRQTPATYIEQNTPNHLSSRQIVTQALDDKRNYLTHREAFDLLDQYDIPVQPTRYAADIDSVVQCAEDIGEAVAIKALHQENAQPFNYDEKSGQRWHDLALDIFSRDEVRHAATRLAYRVSERFGDDASMGFCIQQMKRGFQSMQVNVGFTRDRTFGPLLVFGAGGYTVDVLADRKLMLPPINMALAREMVKGSRIYRILMEHSYQLERDVDQLSEVIVKLSEMIVDLPHLESLEINPLLLNKQGILAVDAAVSISPEPSRLAISPYPGDLAENITLKRSGRPAVIRPIRGEDEPNHLAFYNQLSPESIRMRYFYSRGVPTHQELASWTQIDYDREMAFIVSAPRLDGKGPETLGVVRAVTDPDNIRSEFSVVIRDDLQGEGLGVILMSKVIAYCKARGTLMIEGSTLPSNKGMQGLAQKLGFKNSFNMEEEVVEMKMLLNEPTEDWQITRLQS